MVGRSQKTEFEAAGPSVSIIRKPREMTVWSLLFSFSFCLWLESSTYKIGSPSLVDAPGGVFPW